MSDDSEPGHGNSPAAWTAVIIMLVGFAAGTIFFWFEMPIGVWVCVGVIVLGLVIGLVLARLGYGVRGPRSVPKARP